MWLTRNIAIEATTRRYASENYIKIAELLYEETICCDPDSQGNCSKSDILELRTIVEHKSLLD